METVGTDISHAETARALPAKSIETKSSKTKSNKKSKRRCWWWRNRELPRLARRQVLIACLLMAISLLGRLALLPIAPIPEPGIQDEFSYLLAAETFASGRLTNPTHPLWPHFETVHEIMRPSYQSKYPPAQGMLLALGQVVFGQPWYGVWLSVGAMVGAIYWACAGWLPPRWALLAGVIALLKVGMINYWTSSYWGGAVAAGAGALVIGAVARLRVRPTVRLSLVFAVGLAVLANSRPLEGAWLGLGAVGLLIYDLARAKALFTQVALRQFWAPLALVLLLTVVWMLYYNYRVTGNPLDTPYGSHHRQYDITTPFIWDTKAHPQPPVITAHVRAAHQAEYNDRAHQLSWRWRLDDVLTLSQQYLGILLSLCTLCAFPFIRWWRLRVGPLLAMCLPLLLWLFTYVWVSPHYAAPATAAYFIFGAAVLRRLFHAWPAATQYLVAFVLINAVWQYKNPRNQWLSDKRAHIAARRSVVHQLEQAPGEKVVFVEYAPGHDAGGDVNQEWIFNHADIDHSFIVWAHDLGPAQNQEVIDYYRGRRFWRLVAYPGGKLDLTELTGVHPNPIR